MKSHFMDVPMLIPIYFVLFIFLNWAGFRRIIVWQLTASFYSFVMNCAFQAKWCFKDLTFNKILMASLEGQVVV